MRQSQTVKITYNLPKGGAVNKSIKLKRTPSPRKAPRRIKRA